MEPGPVRHLFNGASSFAEDPRVSAPQARILWDAALDPETLRAVARPASLDDPDAIPLGALAPWLTIVTDREGCDHAVLSDGFRRIRLDIASGRLTRGPVTLLYLLEGVYSVGPKLLPLRRLIHLCVNRRFAVSLFPADPRVQRWLLALRVRDAAQAGASQREIGELLFGAARIGMEWTGPSDSLRSRVRRLAAEAHRLAKGGYRSLMLRRSRPDEAG